IENVYKNQTLINLTLKREGPRGSSLLLLPYLFTLFPFFSSEKTFFFTQLAYKSTFIYKFAQK
ncbi:hypothetical protein, partial [Bacteroides xylanisolvens]|uniref:hypothetical protein n=1 Tax=Bacteroides xylanisolvens TaxID=371601 RepID=UPI001960C8D5